MSIILLLWLVLGVGGFGLWVWALYDCLSRKDEDFPGQGDNNKLVWVLVIVLANLVGALLYLFMVKMRSPKSNSLN